MVLGGRVAACWALRPSCAQLCVSGVLHKPLDVRQLAVDGGGGGEAGRHSAYRIVANVDSSGAPHAPSAYGVEEDAESVKEHAEELRDHQEGVGEDDHVARNACGTDLEEAPVHIVAAVVGAEHDGDGQHDERHREHREAGLLLQVGELRLLSLRVHRTELERVVQALEEVAHRVVGHEAEQRGQLLVLLSPHLALLVLAQQGLHLRRPGGGAELGAQLGDGGAELRAVTEFDTKLLRNGQGAV